MSDEAQFTQEEVDAVWFAAGAVEDFAGERATSQAEIDEGRAAADFVRSIAAKMARLSGLAALGE